MDLIQVAGFRIQLKIRPHILYKRLNKYLNYSIMKNLISLSIKILHVFLTEMISFKGI